VDGRASVAAPPDAGQLTMDAGAWDKAKDLIAAALELPASERDAFLDARCADPSVLAEVREMIRDFADNPDFLERPISLPRIDEIDAVDDGLEPGSQIGPYVVLDRLGRGGMGQVFLGSDRRLKRKVALKRLLPSHLGAGDERARILREAQAAARINHPNVATIHDVIEHETGVFIVMEYVEGESLAARLRRERLPIDRVVSIARQLAAGVGAAHANGIVHRDLKPGNIQLMPDGTAKVLDFGVAQATVSLTSAARDTTTARRGRLDVRGGQPGTPEYMSPEQMVGREVDERSDIFSLGVVLFEMATGRRPYPDGDVLERFAAIEQPAPRADAVDSRVPAALADVIATALDVDVQKRFQLAADMLAALEHVQHTLDTARTITASGAVTRERLSSRALRVVTLLVGAVVTLGLLGFISTAAFNVTLQRHPPFASESILEYVNWGFKSNLAPLVFAVAASMLAAALSFVARMLATVKRLNWAAVRARQTRRRIASALHLYEPTSLAQGLALIGTLGAAGVIWRYQHLIAAFMQRISLASPEQLLPLAPENAGERAPYGILVNILMLTCGAGFFRVMQLRARQRPREGSTPVVIAALVLTAVVLMQQIPYRIVWQNKFERIELAATRCYVIGQHQTDWLVYCPDASVPRNRVIRRDDPGILRTGIVESIFTTATGNPSAASPR
jgi:serine/threonine protein kinase